jgi:Mg2+ and Co2+ transporter CorA
MISKYNHGELVWIDLESPSEEEINHIMEQYSIPTYIEDKIKITRKEDEIDIGDNFIFVKLHIPHKSNQNKSVIFVVSDNLVLTIHYNPIQAFNKFGKEMELDIILDEKSKIKNNKLLFAYLLKNLYLNLETQKLENGITIEKLQKHILGKDKRLKLFIFLSILLLVTTIIFICL